MEQQRGNGGLSSAPRAKEEKGEPMLDQPKSEIQMLSGEVEVGGGASGRQEQAANKRQSGDKGLRGSGEKDFGISEMAGNPVSRARCLEWCIMSYGNIWSQGSGRIGTRWKMSEQRVASGMRCLVGPVRVLVWFVWAAKRISWVIRRNL